MRFKPDIHHRQSIRLPGYDYSQPGGYFITICTHQRQPLLGDIVDGCMMLNAAGRKVESVWRELPQHYSSVVLGEHIVMPNHFHGIVLVGAPLAAPQINNAAPYIYSAEPHRGAEPDQAIKPHRGTKPNQGAASSAPTLGNIIRRFKSVSAIAVNACLKREGQPVWQRNYYEHIVRNDYAYLKIVEYIRTNPQKWQDDIYCPKSGEELPVMI